jgi:cyclopropane fatty-acyl-phospholipid synthase-like methyltransferase
MREETVPLDHFEALYQMWPDPGHLATSPYEAAKYEATLAALPRARYGRGLEIGAAIGVFTAKLAARCDDRLGLEPVASALAEARRRNAHLPHVRFAPLFVPGDWPQGQFDLIVLAEVIDYLGEPDVARLATRVADALAPEGDVILVHWIGKKTGAPSGREASDLFIAAAHARLEVRNAERNPQYRLDVLRRR